MNTRIISSRLRTFLLGGKNVHFARGLLVTLVLGSAWGYVNNLAGKWEGVMVSDRGSGPFYLTLEQNGTAISGRAGPLPDHQRPLEKIEVNGNAVSFEMADSPQRIVRVKLILEDEQMTGTATSPNGRTAQLKLKRR